MNTDSNEVLLSTHDLDQFISACICHSCRFSERIWRLWSLDDAGPTNLPCRVARDPSDGTLTPRLRPEMRILIAVCAVIVTSLGFFGKQLYMSVVPPGPAGQVYLDAAETVTARKRMDGYDVYILIIERGRRWECWICTIVSIALSILIGIARNRRNKPSCHVPGRTRPDPSPSCQPVVQNVASAATYRNLFNFMWHSARHVPQDSQNILVCIRSQRTNRNLASKSI